MDLLFLKKLDTKHWLGLRMPPRLSIVAGNDSKVLEPPPQWTLGEMPQIPWTGARYYGPSVLRNVDAQAREVFAFTWAEQANGRLAGPAFSGVLADVAAMPDSEATKKLRDRLEAMQTETAVSLPLRAYRAYVETQPSIKRATGEWQDHTIDEWKDVVIAALSDRPGQMPIESVGGLLFLVESEDPPAEVPNVFVDAPEPASAGAVELQVKAFQHSKGVVFECAEAVGSAAYTNQTVRQAVGAAAYSGYYRLTRTLGVVERPSRRSALVALPNEVIDATNWDAPVAGMPPREPWGQRRFRLSDNLAPDELIGELLNYRLELLNPHGRVVRAGRVMLQRQRLDPPAALTRAMVRLVSKPATADATMAIRFDLPPMEEANRAGLELIVYRLENPALPTGFYGDSDDAAVQVARLLSDIDPAAYMDVRAGDQVLTGASSQSAQANLSNHGLEFFKSIKLEGLQPRGTSASGSADEGSWSQCRWEVAVEPLLQLLPSERAVRVMLALRRTVAGDSSASVVDGPVPESPVLEPQMLIGVDAANAERDQVVPHFERFWEAPEQLALLGEDQVFLSEAEPPDEANPTNDADNYARVRLQVQHLAPQSTPGAGAIGGYRIWLRDLPARHAQDVPFDALAVVQAVPQLVKAYAPIEMGRQWWVEVASDALGDANAPLGAGFLASPSPQSMIRGKEEAEDVVPQLSAVLKEIQEGKASKRDVRGGALLLRLWRLLKKEEEKEGEPKKEEVCREVILTVAQRRELEREGARKWFDSPLRAGNWIVFRDQNGGYLGRAWTFKGALAGRVARVHVLNEVPNTEDTVAVDEFGQITWNWAGLPDTWHHELEWVVEPLSRYAPLRRRRLPRPVAVPGDDPKVETRYPLPPWQSGQAAMKVPEGHVHRLAILRRAPMTGRVGLIPIPDDAEDAFVWRVNLPPEFRRATHNTHARTALGALRLEVIEATATTRLASAFAPVGVMDELIEDWCKESPPEQTTLEVVDEGHRLVVHQPACFHVMLKVRARADTKAGDVTALQQAAERVPKTFKNTKAMEFDRCYPDGQNQELVIPLARLGWSYLGPAKPTVEAVIGRAAPSPLPGLRLPDPAASLTVFFQEDDGVLRPCAYFFGPEVAQGNPPTPADWQPETAGTVRWGNAYRDDKAVRGMDLIPGGAQAGKLVLKLNGAIASRLRVLWKRGGVASDLVTPKP